MDSSIKLPKCVALHEKAIAWDVKIYDPENVFYHSIPPRPSCKRPDDVHRVQAPVLVSVYAPDFSQFAIRGYRIDKLEITTLCSEGFLGGVEKSIINKDQKILDNSDVYKLSTMCKNHLCDSLLSSLYIGSSIKYPKPEEYECSWNSDVKKKSTVFIITAISVQFDSSGTILHPAMGMTCSVTSSNHCRQSQNHYMIVYPYVKFDKCKVVLKLIAPGVISFVDDPREYDPNTYITIPQSRLRFWFSNKLESHPVICTLKNVQLRETSDGYLIGLSDGSSKNYVPTRESNISGVGLSRFFDFSSEAIPRDRQEVAKLLTEFRTKTNRTKRSTKATSNKKARRESNPGISYPASVLPKSDLPSAKKLPQISVNKKDQAESHNDDIATYDFIQRSYTRAELQYGLHQILINIQSLRQDLNYEFCKIKAFEWDIAYSSLLTNPSLMASWLYPIETVKGAYKNNMIEVTYGKTVFDLCVPFSPTYEGLYMKLMHKNEWFWLHATTGIMTNSEPQFVTPISLTSFVIPTLPSGYMDIKLGVYFDDQNSFTLSTTNTTNIVFSNKEMISIHALTQWGVTEDHYESFLMTDIIEKANLIPDVESSFDRMIASPTKRLWTTMSSGFKTTTNWVVFLIGICVFLYITGQIIVPCYNGVMKRRIKRNSNEIRSEAYKARSNLLPF